MFAFNRKINGYIKKIKEKEKQKINKKEVKQIQNETLFKDPCLKQSSHHLFGPLLSFTFIPLALAMIQA